MHETSIALSRRFTSVVEPQDAGAPSVWRQGLPQLHGRLATLRELELADSVHLLTLLTAPEVMRFLSPPPHSLERFTGFIETTRLERSAGRYAGFAIVPHGVGHPVGVVQLRQLEPNFRTAEWGVALGSSWWGRGLFLDAAQLVLDFAFTTLGVERLEARVAAGNARGNGAVEKLGAVAEGLLRQSLLVADGTRHDQVLWSWLQADWRQARRAAAEAHSWVH
jgi:ribosomal-protein-alanine N-acetyltransferase